MECRDFFEAVAGSGAHPRPRNLRFYMTQLFRGVDFRDKRVLDIGGGAGLLTLYAASQGARMAVCLEPELDGSSRGMQETFARTAQLLPWGDRARFFVDTFQELSWQGEPFDVILLHNSINHLDERATKRLHQDSSARSSYRALFSKMDRVSSNDARLMIADCDRYNLWRFVPLVSPAFTRSIQWDKHQPPKRWASLAEAGRFHLESVRWTTFNRLRKPGQILLGNRLAAFMLRSHFVMWLQKR